MCNKSLLILEKSIDFNIEVLPPRKSDLRTDLQDRLSEGSYTNYWNTENLTFDNIYKIRMIIECKANSNLDVFVDYFINTLNAVKMSESEIDFAKQSASDLVEFSILEYGSFYLRNPESIKIIKLLFQKSTLNLVNYDIVANDDIIKYTPFFKTELPNNVDSHYQLLKIKTEQIDIIDSSHYVFIYNLLSSRSIGYDGLYLDENYPTNFDETVGIPIYETNSDFNSAAFSNYVIENIYHQIYASRDNSKKTITSKNMNTRYQALDYYLPLSDVEKLDSVRIVKKK